MVADVAWENNWDAVVMPMADGGEGTLEALHANGGVLQTTTVTGPLGQPVDAVWLLRGRTAFIEMARASGLALVGGPEGNRALDATTYGTGQLLNAALAAGVKRIVVALGGSATTDGGLGALEAMAPLARFRGTELLVACDVETMFVDAAASFGPQKGASPAQVALLRGRLEQLADRYLDERGVDVRLVPGGGAAGGLSGALASLGARTTSGFRFVADEAGLADAIAGATLVITARVDSTKNLSTARWWAACARSHGPPGSQSPSSPGPLIRMSSFPLTSGRRSPTSSPLRRCSAQVGRGPSPSVASVRAFLPYSGNAWHSRGESAKYESSSG